MKPEMIADYNCHTGESPLWHPFEKQIYWVDAPKGLIFRYNPSTCEHGICYRGAPVGGMTVQADGAMLLFMDHGAVAIWRHEKLEYIIKEIPEERESRFNDAITDPEGCVFCGTLPTKDRLGKLYCLDTTGYIRLVQDSVDMSNGMGFTADGKHLYHTESNTRTIYIYDYDRKSSKLTNRRVFIETPEGEGVPDGMTVDAEGYIWSARWNGGVLVRYTPWGDEERRIQFPARKISSITFGDEDLSALYVTTGGGNNKPEEGTDAGALFRLRLGIKGVPEFFSRIGL